MQAPGIIAVSVLSLAWTISPSPSPRIVLLGPSLVGKSTLANVLSGSSSFQPCDSPTSCTAEVTIREEIFLGDDTWGSLTIADCPGVGITWTGEEGDGPAMANIADTLISDLMEANLIILCIQTSYNDLQYNTPGPEIQDMLVVLETMVGAARLWGRVLIEMTHWNYTPETILWRKQYGITENTTLA